jgi:branched-chain amino acid transport system substrate-binding protein
MVRSLRVVRTAVVIAALVLVATACGARFDEEESTGGLEAGAPSSAVSTTTPVTLPAGPGRTTGVSDDEIKVGFLLPITGAAPVPSRFDKGVSAYWDYVNAQGGIGGRRVTVVIEDTQSQAEVGKDKAKKLVEDDEVFAIVVLDRLENQEAIGSYLNELEVPTISVQTTADMPDDEIWNFNVTIDHGLQGEVVADYFVNELGLEKVGVVRENTPALDPGVEQFEQEVDELGAEVVISRAIEGQATDFLNEALALSESGAEAVWLYMAPLPAAKIANQSNDAGFHPIWFANSISWAFDLTFAVAPEALENARAFSPWLPISDPRTATYQEQYRANNNGETPDDLGIIGWGLGQIIGEGIRQAGPELGQNSFRDAMQHLQFSPDVWVPLAFDDGVREGANQVAVLAEENGRWVVEHDFTSGF